MAEIRNLRAPLVRKLRAGFARTAVPAAEVAASILMLGLLLSII